VRKSRSSSLRCDAKQDEGKPSCKSLRSASKNQGHEVVIAGSVAEATQQQAQDEGSVPRNGMSGSRGNAHISSQVKPPSYPRVDLKLRNYSSISEWKRIHQCDPNQRVFICDGMYPDFRNALLARGWHENSEHRSQHFDLKWGMEKWIDFENLRPHQIVNHFDRSREIATKSGLTLTLRSAAWICGTGSDSFYPRAYDLFDPMERSDFVLDFKLTKAEAILRRCLELIDSNAEATFSKDIVRDALKICLRMVTDVDEVIDCPEIAMAINNVSAGEWSSLQKVCLDDPSQLETCFADEDLECLINRKALTVVKSAAAARDSSKKESCNGSLLLVQRGSKSIVGGTKSEENEEEEMPLSSPVVSFTDTRGLFLVAQVRRILADLEKSNAQHLINGARNAWIIKPSGKSRGRGIRMIRDLSKIFHATERDGFRWICQKYIERPQLIHGYKFDIRQWVLVVDWSPLTVYIWREPYIRFAGQKYDATLENENEYMHLVNNSIIKHMDGFGAYNDDLHATGYMWFRQQYQEWLHKTHCKHAQHRTPWLHDPPYTCEKFGVRWEDVAFVAKDDEEDEDAKDACDDEQQQDSNSSHASPGVGPSICGMPCKPNNAEQSNGDATVQNAAKQPNVPHDSNVGTGTCGIDCPASATVEPNGDCEDMWNTSIKPQIKDIVVWSLLCAQDSVQHRKNSLELYGYDFMIADEGDSLKVWLIEINSSPACDYSTPVTCPLVKQMMEDTAKVVVDLRDDPQAHTGEWELVHHEFCQSLPHKKPGHESHTKLEVLGTRITPPGTRKKDKVGSRYC